MFFLNNHCKKCGKKYANAEHKWCKPCQTDFLRANFTNWSSGNVQIDEFIQEMQLKLDDYDDMVFEWIAYNQFSDVKEISKSGFSTLCSVIWKDGSLYYSSNEKKLMRESNKKVGLKCLNYSQNTTAFLNEV